MQLRQFLGIVLAFGVLPNSVAWAQTIDYLRDVKPLLEKRCVACHGPLRQESGLRLDASQLFRKGGESGPLYESGKSGDSLLIGVVTGDAGFTMPPEGEPLDAKQIAILKAWIDQGAKAPQKEDVSEDPRDHWSYQPVERPEIPKVKNSAWVRNPIDAFVAAQHERRGLVPRPAAEKSVLLRRVSLDLIGLPPTRDELHAFLSDNSPQAYEKVVNRLLDSPRYGERWGRHWMDIWRYSDWYGRRASNEIRYGQRHIWRWRDWIVESLNADKGYDRMIVEMLAGDEVAPTDPKTLRATGFLGRNWYKFDRNVWLRETVEHTAMGFMAITMKCVRCHNHKFDPIAQEEYYRFRAFFEPHDVRIDRLSVRTGTEKDAKIGAVLKDGLSRIYDKTIDAPTYLFIRGDDRRPDKDNPLSPGVPSALGNSTVDVRAIPLPVESYYPELRPKLIAERIAVAEQNIQQAQSEATSAIRNVALTKQKLDQFIAAENTGQPEQVDVPQKNIFISDDFKKPRPNVWEPLTGRWEYKDGRLLQSQVGSWLTMVSRENHPQNFMARIRYQTAKAGGIHSVGIAFDVVGRQHWQAIYTYPGSHSAVQAFHRENGRETYPSVGIVPHPIRLDEEIVLDVAVRGQLLNVWVNGELKIAYTMPMSRRPGQFALWNHSATADYYELRIEALPAVFQLATSAPAETRSPFVTATQEDYQRSYQTARFAIRLAKKNVETAQAERVSLKTRIAADRAKFIKNSEPAIIKNLSLAAGKAERHAAVLKAEEAVLKAEQAVNVEKAKLAAKPAATNKPLTDAEKKLTIAKKTLTTAIAAAKKESEQYSPLGTAYPKTSTGRRTALARWIVDRKNPRTARVAANHIWLRHFGAAIVEPVSDFGLRSKPRTHPKLLDWLALQLVENRWSMKHLHRLMVTSRTYRMKSSAGGSENPNLKIDPENKFLWRMNFRRMEAETVRDSVLFVGGQLDTTMGGPEIPESQGQTSLRRSLYFRATPNETMPFLEIFDLANPDECYRRKESVVPQQVLAMTNSTVALSQSRLLARRLSKKVLRQPASAVANDTTFIIAAFENILSRAPTKLEQQRCRSFLDDHRTLLSKTDGLTPFPSNTQKTVAPSTNPKLRARENLVHVLFNHNDFVTIR